jgi:hypothetical protein
MSTSTLSACNGAIDSILMVVNVNVIFGNCSSIHGKHGHRHFRNINSSMSNTTAKATATATGTATTKVAVTVTQ